MWMWKIGFNHRAIRSMADQEEGSPAALRFWEHKSLEEMSQREWESLCDGCGKCCLHKLEDEDSGELLFTSVACRYLDAESCRCTVYETRKQHVPDCLTLRLEAMEHLRWLPSTCAYRLLYEGKALPTWHPLVSGSKESVHRSHISVRNKVVSEADVAEDDLDLYVIDNMN